MKNKRQEMMLRVISENVIVTQDELQEALEKRGFQVTQSTVSRDIKQLRIVKAQDVNGIYRYSAPRANTAPVREQNPDHYLDMFSKAVTGVDYALNNIVIKCYTGMAQSACVAFDSMFGEQILGTLAGDDTILVVTRSEQDAKALTETIANLIM